MSKHPFFSFFDDTFHSQSVFLLRLRFHFKEVPFQGKYGSRLKSSPIFKLDPPSVKNIAKYSLVAPRHCINSAASQLGRKSCFLDESVLRATRSSCAATPSCATLPRRPSTTAASRSTASSWTATCRSEDLPWRSTVKASPWITIRKRVFWRQRGHFISIRKTDPNSSSL